MAFTIYHNIYLSQISNVYLPDLDHHVGLRAPGLFLALFAVELGGGSHFGSNFSWDK